MKSKKIPLIVIVVTIAAGAAGAWWWQRATKIQAIAATSVPAMPDVSTSAPILREQLAAAEASAHSRFGAHRGLAKLSRIYHANGFLNEAVRCYEGLEQVDPSEPRCLHFHATILAGYGEIESAAVLWRRVVALAPDFIPAQLRLGDCELKSNQPIEAAAIYTKVLQRDAKNSYALLGLARLDYEAKRWDKAQERLETVVQQTNYNLGYDLIVTLYEQTGQPDRATAIRASRKASGAFRDPPDAWLDDLMDVCFDPYRLALNAGFIERNGDPAKAVKLLERAIELAPDDVSLRFQLGMMGLTQGNLTVAREQLERCTRLAPGFPDGWAQLSALQTKTGELSAAAQTLAKGLATCPQSPGLHLMRARDLQKAGLAAEAISEFRESIRLRPNEAEAYIQLANYYIKLNQINEAVPLLQQAIEAEPGNPMALATLTFHAISTGDESTALRWFSKVRNQPRVPADQVEQIRTAFQQQFGHPLR